MSYLLEQTSLGRRHPSSQAREPAEPGARTARGLTGWSRSGSLETSRPRNLRAHAAPRSWASTASRKSTVLWRSNGGPPSLGTLIAKRKPKKTTLRFAYWKAPRSKKQCAENFLQAKRRANEVRFILQSFDGGNLSIAIDFSVLRNRAPRPNGQRFSLDADCSPRPGQRPPNCWTVHCKQCARPGDADDNRTLWLFRRPDHLRA